MSPEQIFENQIYSRYPAGIFYPEEYSPNYILCNWINEVVNSYFEKMLYRNYQGFNWLYLFYFQELPAGQWFSDWRIGV